LKIIDDIRNAERSKWREFVENHPSNTIFQSPDFSDLFVNDSHYIPVFIGATDNTGKYLGLIFGFTIQDYSGVKRQFSTRTIIYGGPLIAPDSDKPEFIIRVLLESFIKIVSRSSIYIEFRNFHDFSRFKDIFKQYGFHFREHLNQIISTQDLKKVQSEISKSKLRQIRKSLASGAVIKQVTSNKEFDEFYLLLKRLYHEKVRKPLPSFEFFQKFYTESRKEKLGTILVVKHKEKVVAGMVCLITKNKTLHEWYVCGADGDYKEIFPSVLITWGGIKYAIDKHLSFFDFMGTGLPGIENGIRHFKTRFGGKTVNYGRFIRINKKVKYLISISGYFFLALFRKV
jgi:hypothetical protein